MISVIIPLYNAEKYIAFTINSVLKQTFTNIEVVLINDGSTDSSLEICQEFAEKDSRVKIFNQSNGGVSSARNLGLRKATGSYFFFLDADDILIPNCLELLFNEQQSNPESLIISNFEKFYSDEKITIESVMCEQNKRIFTLVEFYREILLLRYNTYPWGTLVKASFFQNIEFPEHMSCFEDLATMYKVYERASNIIFINLPLVYYRQSQFSAVKTMNLRKVYNYVEAADSFCSYVTMRYPDLKDYEAVFKSYVYLSILQIDAIDDALDLKKSCMAYLDNNIGKACDYSFNNRQLLKFRLYKKSKTLFWMLRKINTLRRNYFKI